MTTTLPMRSWTNSPGDDSRGRTVPRRWTRPLRELTPDTSYGYDVIRFAERVLGRRLYPWQEWLLIHACELLPDGRPRFRTVLVEVGRQNGKTEIPVILAAFWIFVERVALVLGTSTTLDYAREPLDKMVAYVEASPLARRVAPGWQRTTNGQVWATVRHRRRGGLPASVSRYRTAARNRKAGRSLPVNRLIVDELREHQDYLTWDAAYNAMRASPDGQVWALSNAGDPRSVVLNDMRGLAEEDGDPLLGYFGWTAPPDADPRDVDALLQANPSTGYGGIRLDILLAEAEAALQAGGQKLTGFRTESMCITVATLDPAIDPGAWRACADPGTLDGVRDRVALCVDASPDAQHVTLTAAALLPDGRVRLEPVEAWAGVGATVRAARALPAIVGKVRPRTVGWFPTGPGAELAADMVGRRGWPPRGITLQEISGDVAAACMSLRSLVLAGEIAHSSDPLQDAHIAAAERLERGDTWVFARRGTRHRDAAYAAAGAVQLARTLPPAVGKPRIVAVTRSGSEL